MNCLKTIDMKTLTEKVFKNSYFYCGKILKIIQKTKHHTPYFNDAFSFSIQSTHSQKSKS